MKRLFLIGACICALAAPAMAGGSANCTTAPKATWKSVKDIEAVAKAAGYEVRKTKVLASCYEVYGVAKDGILWELFYDPATGKLIKTEKK